MSDQRSGETSKPSTIQAGEEGGGEAAPRDRRHDDGEPASALGGGTATRSSTAEAPDPAEEQG